MATTTNFGWETPDDTDLVKDGAAAIRTALGGVDTSFVDLKGGTTGQLLAKASGTDLDFTWGAAPTPPFVGCSLYKSTAQTVSNVTNTALTFDTESYDTNTFHSTSSNTSRITIPAGYAGKYLLHGTIGYGAGSNGSTLRSAYIAKNGSPAKYVVVTLGVGNDDNGRLSFACTLDLAVNDYVELFFYQPSGGNMSVEGGIDRTSFYANYQGV
jgi:hypothetical protein